MGGMGGANQGTVDVLIKHGADIEALDTYGFTPLHRMASNNLADGARKLLEAGANLGNKGACGSTPLEVAKSSAARDVIRVFQEFGKAGRQHVPITKITVMNAGNPDVNGDYEVRN